MDEKPTQDTGSQSARAPGYPPRMTKSEYASEHGIKTEQDWCNHFRENMRLRRLPVAIYSCLYCDEILWDGEGKGHACFARS